MITVLRSAGMRFVIYPNDHDPAHLHVYGDGEARIDIKRVAVISNRGMKKPDLALALDIVRKENAMLLVKWQEIHG